MGAVDGREQRVARAGPGDAVGEHQPQPVPGGRAGERGVRREFQPVEERPAVHHDAAGGRVVEDDDESGRRVQRTGCAARRHERARRGEDDRHDEGGPQHEQEQVA